MNYIKGEDLKVGDRVLSIGTTHEITEVVFGPYSKVAYRTSTGLVHETTLTSTMLIEDRPSPEPRFTIEYARYKGLVAANLRAGGAIFRLGTYEKTDEMALSSLMNRLVGDAKNLP